MDPRAYKRFRLRADPYLLRTLRGELYRLGLRSGAHYQLTVPTGSLALLEFYNPAAIVADYVRKQALDGALYQARAVPE